MEVLIIMKKYVAAGLIGSLLLVGCSNQSKEDVTKENEQVGSSALKEVNAATESDKQSNLTVENNENKSNNEDNVDANENVDVEDDNTATSIDTSIYKDSKSIEVVDGRELNQHLTLKIDLQDGANPGMGTLDVLTNTFDFLEQADIAGANTITILVRVKDVKVSQFKVYTEKFKPNDEDPMADLVLAASDIEYLLPEVKSFGEVMGLW